MVRKSSDDIYCFHNSQFPPKGLWFFKNEWDLVNLPLVRLHEGECISERSLRAYCQEDCFEVCLWLETGDEILLSL
jgi:hypothetical protein